MHRDRRVHDPQAALAAPRIPVPLAPACNQWGFPNGGNGITINGATQSILFQAGGTEVYQSPGALTGAHTQSQSGYLNGSIHGGTLNLSWKSDSTAEQATFNGTVDGNGNLAGTASFSNGNNAPFAGKNKMVCQDAPQQQQTPADNGSAPPQQGPQQSALPKITGGDVDLYTQPGGVGSPRGRGEKRYLG